MPQDQCWMVPSGANEAALQDDYEDFLTQRSAFLQDEALKLAGLDSSGAILPTLDTDEDFNASD